MNSDEEFQVGDLRSLTLLKLLWKIWIVLTGIIALGLTLFIFFAIVYLPIFLRSPTEEVHILTPFTSVPAYFVIFAGIIGIIFWVLFLGNIYISYGLNKLDYFRWKLLVIESSLIGIVAGILSLTMILTIERALSIYESRQLLALVGVIGLCLVLLILAFKVRGIFREK
ncbi:MAG: hypothetical protein ACFFAJ_18175 [Candidatus Hodarchaeota archaeon]